MSANPFTAHPATVGETYFQHMRSAGAFAVLLFLGSMACLLHAILPFAFERTGSNFVRTLYDRMVTNRAAHARRATQAASRA